MGSPQTSASSSYRWVILGVLCLLYVAFGLVSRAIFPLVTPILKDLHLSYSQMGLILGSWQLTYIGSSLFLGTILDRWGTRRAILAGIGIMGLSSALRAAAVGLWTMWGAVALFGLGGPMISIGGPKVIAQWFEGRSRGTAIGLFMIGPFLGAFLSLSLTNSLVMPALDYSWRGTFLLYGGMALAAGLIWAFTGRDKTLSAGQEQGVMNAFVKLFGSGTVRTILIMAFMTFSVTHGFISWLPKILETRGFSPSDAGWAAALPMAVGIPAVMLIPRLVPPESRRRYLAGLALLTGAAIILVFLASGLWLILGLILMGAVMSSYTPLMLLILMDRPEVGAKAMGAAGGMFFCAGEIGGATGPLILGVLVDLSGSFWSGAFFLALLCLAITGLTFRLAPERRLF